MFVKQ